MRAILPNKNGSVTITQGEYDTPSHQNQYTLDYGIDFYAPFNLKKIGVSYFGGGHQQYFTSDGKIDLPSGGYDYISIMAEHSNDNAPSRAKKGELVCRMGMYGTASKHLHMVFGKGKINSSKIGDFGHKNSAGYYEPLCMNIVSSNTLFYAPNHISWLYDSRQIKYKDVNSVNTKYYLKVYLDKDNDVRYYRKGGNRYILNCVNQVNIYYDKEMKKRIDTKMFQPGQKIEATAVGFNEWRTNDGRSTRYYMYHLQENQYGVDIWIPYKKETK